MFMYLFLCVFLSFSLSLVAVVLILQVYDSSTIAYPPIVHSHGLITTILGLNLVLESSHFQNGSIRVKCLTSVAPVVAMHSSSDSSAAEARESSLSSITNGNRKPNVLQRKPPLAESREAFLLGK